jgi:hypothetical protein
MNRERWRREPDHMRAISKKYYYARRDDGVRKRAAEKTKEYAAKTKRENPAKWRARRFFDSRDKASPDVTFGLIEELFRTTSNCQCCGKELEIGFSGTNPNGWRTNSNAPSIDRVNSRKGYILGNIAVICWNCNHRKTDLSLDDLEMFKSYMLRYGEF